METFRKGDPVIYGSNGICMVADVTTQASAPGAEARTYYILSQENNRCLTIAVPTDNLALVSRMRRILTREEIDALLAEAKGQTLPWIPDRRVRADTFHAILTAGMHRDLLLMIRCLYLQRQTLLQSGKRLNVADESTLKAAEKLVTEEFSYALEIEPHAVGDYIRQALEIASPSD